MTITDAEMAALLAPGGFRFLRRLAEDEAPPLPTPPDRGAASCLREHGRIDSPPVPSPHGVVLISRRPSRLITVNSGTNLRSM
ncbi:hypothetical protein ACFXKY_29105 [Streptomyces canus]|uniref:hypothetical protein n=1 Tax=Streptomyces canus TaxID=58343 RepID=UPI0036C29B5D